MTHEGRGSGFAQDHPEIPVIHASGDASWKEGRDFKDLPNMVNLMGEMEYGKMMAGRGGTHHPDRQDPATWDR